MAFQEASSSSTSSSSSFTGQWAYDVLLSFRGEDTRNNFTAHLYRALIQMGINTYIDNDLERGENISPALLKAIEDSRIAVIVFSQNYASSSWCLDELTKIVQCKEKNEQIVVPVFYKVDPSEIRHQKKSFGEAFIKHEERFKNDQKKVQKWKTDLTQVANLSGWHLGNKNEPEFIREIIEWVNSKLVKNTYFQVAKHPVGIESHEQHLKSLLNIEKIDSTYMIGIFGTGEIGKTTIAKAIYNSIASRFEGSCFLEDIRETSGRMDGMIHLQNKLLSMILGGSSLMVDNVDQGISLIKQRLRLKRILLVLDNVDQLFQLEKLAGKDDWFSLGSRIIITTRNKHLLTAHGVDSRYQVNEMDHDKALQLFSWYAFNKDRPDHDYVEITEEAVRYTGGLPLALTVLGSTLKGKNLPYWKCKLDVYNRIPPHDIQQKLRISFDGLEESAKIIFLDIACFFKGENVEYVKKVLDSRGFDSCGDIEELKDKCLINECGGDLVMHDMLQEMGREIVRQESPKEPGQRSRLWFHKDVRDVLEGATGTNKVEGILIDLPVRDQIHLSPKAFKKMKMLRMLINRNARFFEEPNFLSNELRLLDWPEYPGQSFPSNFRGENLVVLRMHDSHLKGFRRVQNFPNMTILDFSSFKFLRKIPNVSRIPNLEKLVLNDCKELVKVHRSVGLLNKLVVLSLRSCSNLRSFPRSFKLISLKTLVLWGCSKLKNFPEIECQMECLEDINLGNSGIEQLNLKGCSKVVKFLKKVKDNKQFMPAIVSVEESAISSGADLLQLLALTNTSDYNDCCSSISFPKLRSLNLSNCALSESNFFRTFDCTSASYNLNLLGSDIVTLPQCLESFVGLKTLNLKDCKQLREIQGLPPNVKQVFAMGCVSLEIFLEEATRSQMFNMSNPPEPVRSGTVFRALQSNCPFKSLEYLDLSSTVVVRLPTWFNGFVGLKSLIMKDCKQFREIPKLPPNVESVDLSGSDIVTLPRCIESWFGLKYLYLKDCKQLQKILGLPPNVVDVSAERCVSLAIFLEEAKSSQSLNLGNNVPTESDFLIQHDCPFSLESLNLSGSAIVSFPAWFNKFVGLRRLFLNGCKQLREISKLPPSIEWIDLSNCPQHIRNDFLSERHLKKHQFGCIFPGNKIPNFFSHRKDVSNTNQCEIDINEPVRLDSINTRFAFYAVIGTKTSVPDSPLDWEFPGVACSVTIEVISDGVKTNDHIVHKYIPHQFHSDHLCLHYEVLGSFKLRGDNLRVKFELLKYSLAPLSVFFKSCGFHLEAVDLMDGVQLSKRRHDTPQCLESKFELGAGRYDPLSMFFKRCGFHLEAIDLMDGVQLCKRCRDDDDDDESNWYPQQKRHCSTLGIRISDAEDMPLG